MVAGPLRRVLGAIEDGAGSRAEIQERSGLSREAVEAAVDHLLRVGRLESRPVGPGCAGGSCAGCCERAGCADEDAPRLVALTLRREPTA